MLSSLHFSRIQRNIDEENNIANCLLIPALKEACSYDRCTGFFSIKGLVDLFSGIIPFIKNGGTVRCITSAYISEDDLEVLKAADELKRGKAVELIQATLDEQLKRSDYELAALDVVTNLIAADHIQFCIAVMRSAANYHEKFGVIGDQNGNKIYFSGSANETANGSFFNRESVTVLANWDGPSQDDTIKEEQAYFNGLWSGEDPSVEVFPFPEALKKKLFSLYKRSSNWEEAYAGLYLNEAPEHLAGKDFRQYQEDAINSFITHNGRAFFEMATGTGKTHTAIQAVKRFIKKHGNKYFVLILVPLVDLQEQWEDNLRKEGETPVLVGGKGDPSTKQHLVIDYMTGGESLFCVCVYRTFFQGFSRDVEFLAEQTILVVDEAHNLGPSILSKFSPKIQYRLGLSATPTRYIPKESEDLLGFFLKDGQTTFRYGLAEAIKAGYLSHYYYHPIFVHLNNSEMDDYSYFSKQIAKLMNLEELTVEEEKRLTTFRSKRAAIVKHAEEKFSKLREMLDTPQYDFTRSVVYCGGGSALGDEDSDNDSVVERVLEMLNSHGLFASDFIYSTANRKQVLEQFRNDYYSTLVAIKCLDEGVDVPSLERLYILASDSSVRQTIQRRGRVLRICKETGKSVAHIYDMITLPAFYDGMGSKALVVNEMNRFRAYSELADEDPSEDLEEIRNKIESKYGIIEEDYKQCLMEQQVY